MTLALDASAPAGVAALSSSTLTITTAAFSPPANALMLAKIGENNNTAGKDASATVTSTGGLTWTRQVRKNLNASSDGGAGVDGGAEIWATTTTTAPGSITVTATYVDTNPANVGGIELKVMVITDSSGLAPVVGNKATGSGTGSAPSVNITVIASSFVFDCTSDWNASGVGTIGSGQTVTYDGTNGTITSWHMGRTTSTTSAGTTTMNWTAPTNQTWDMAVLEVQVPAVVWPPSVVDPYNPMM